jgi:hypothetical protein
MGVPVELGLAFCNFLLNISRSGLERSDAREALNGIDLFAWSEVYFNGVRTEFAKPYVCWTDS